MSKTYYCKKQDSKDLIGAPHEKGGFYFNKNVKSAIVIFREEGKEFIRKNDKGEHFKKKNWSDLITGMDIDDGRIIIES